MSTGTKTIAKREVLNVSAGGGGAVLSTTPKSGSLVIFIANSDLISHGIEQTVGSTATANKYSVANNTELTFNATTFASAGKVICYYMLDASKNGFTVDNTSFPGGYKIYADGVIINCLH